MPYPLTLTTMPQRSRLVYVVNHAEDKIILVDEDLVPALEAAADTPAVSEKDVSMPVVPMFHVTAGKFAKRELREKFGEKRFK